MDTDSSSQSASYIPKKAVTYFFFFFFLKLQHHTVNLGVYVYFERQHLHILDRYKYFTLMSINSVKNFFHQELRVRRRILPKINFACQIAIGSTSYRKRMDKAKNQLWFSPTKILYSSVRFFRKRSDSVLMFILSYTRRRRRQFSR